MNCQEAQNFIDGYVDDELDLARSLEIESHLEDCPACAKIRGERLALRSALRSGGFAYDAPAGLERRLRDSLGGRERPMSRQWKLGWIAAAASLAAIVVALVWLRPPGAQEVIAREILSSHIRSLMANHLTDVESSDQHTVKPWFNGKLDFSPPVKDLAAAGFPLAGGRLDYIDGRPVAALVYHRRKHLINVFLWPAPIAADEGERVDSRQGYNLIHWTRAGTTYWVASDLSRDELHSFVTLLR